MSPRLKPMSPTLRGMKPSDSHFRQRERHLWKHADVPPATPTHLPESPMSHIHIAASQLVLESARSSDHS
ncbi:hypothetical protein RRSWK_01306 [Rhodopirellula sp. SWK7]|nr:hypothetical protein RRSWK_01306 [Rhodopirellula sp. SWK7]